MPTTAHVDVPWIMAYDLYPMDTLEFKRAFVREAIEREYIVFFEHDPVITAGIIRLKDRRPYVEPIQYPEAGSRKPEAGSRKLEAGSRKLEDGRRKPDAGSW